MRLEQALKAALGSLFCVCDKQILLLHFPVEESLCHRLLSFRIGPYTGEDSFFLPPILGGGAFTLLLQSFSPELLYLKGKDWVPHHPGPLWTGSSVNSHLHVSLKTRLCALF